MTFGAPFGRVMRPAFGPAIDSSWDPSKLAGLTAWFDFSDATKLFTDNGITPVTADGDSIQQVSDKLLNGNYAREATNKPLYKTGIVNGLSVARFNGSSQKLTTNSFLSAAYNTAFTFYIFAPRAIPTTEVVLAHNGGVFYYMENNDNIYSFHVNSSGLSDTFIKRAYKTTSYANGIVGFSYDGATKRMSISGLHHTEAATGNFGLNGTMNIANYANNLFFGGDIGEILIYNDAHTKTEMNLVLQWLCTKWGKSFTNKYFLCEGDSLTLGTGVYTPYPTQLAALYDSTILTWNHGANGAALSNMDDVVTDLNANLYNDSSCIFMLWGGTNDLQAGVDGADAYTLYANYASALKAAGWKVICMTCLARQQADLHVDFEAQRAIFNAEIRDHYATIGNALADVDGDVRLQDPTNTTYFDADKIHLKTAGYAIVAGLVKTQIDLLL